MDLSAFVLGASLLAGQAEPVQVKDVVTSSKVISSTPVMARESCECCGEAKGLIARLRARLGMCKTCDQTMTSTWSNQMVSSQEPPLASPVRQVVNETKAPEAGLRAEYAPKVGAAEDYSWVTGQLFYLHAAGQGFWVVRYAPVDQEDRYGGSVVLAGAMNMRTFREGDLVCVHGEVLNEGRATKYLGGPLYRVQTLQMLDRSDP